MLIIGIILVIVGGGLFYGRISSQKKLGDISGTETTSVQMLQKTCDGVAGEIGAGGFSEYSELKGKAFTDKPLESKFATRECVYFRAEVIREFEENVVERDSQTGEERRKTERRSEVMSDITQNPPFYCDDGTGKILVHPEGAKIEAIKIMDDFEAEDSSSIQVDGSQLTWGSFNFTMNTGRSGRRILGYRFREWILPLGQQLYILGQATDSEGGLSIRKPLDKKTFLISTRSEEELVSSAHSSTKGFTIGAIASVVLGIVLIIMGLLK